MAPAPLFAPSLAYVQSVMRLTGIVPASDSESKFFAAVQSAAVAFYAGLGSASQIATLQGYAYTENPSTEEEFLRSLAVTTELDLVRLNLIDTMTVLYKDGGADVVEEWNTDGFLRDSGALDLELRAQLTARISLAMGVLSGATSLADLDEPLVTVIGGQDPSRPTKYPGSTIYGNIPPYA